MEVWRITRPYMPELTAFQAFNPNNSFLAGVFHVPQFRQAKEIQIFRHGPEGRGDFHRTAHSNADRRNRGSPTERTGDAPKERPVRNAADGQFAMCRKTSSRQF